MTAAQATNGSMHMSPPQTGRIRIAIVDDSEVYRIFLRKMLLENLDFEVICLASNGRLALPRIRHYKPDVVILDYDMPELNGLETIKAIREFSASIRIIMFSAHTLKGAKITLEALESGAEDFITKPGFEPGDLKRIGAILPEKIRQLVAHRRVKAADSDRYAAIPNQEAEGYRFCGIGISTGGPTALRRLLPLIPKSVKGSLFIVQHLPALFTKQLAENLDTVTELTVVEAEDGMVPQNGYVYIAPGGKQMIVADEGSASGTIRIFEGPHEELCKPSVNTLFNSLAQNFGARSVGVIMTGMGEDGLIGMRSMHRMGSYLMAQSREDCLIYGMPAKPTGEGLVATTGDIETLGRKITNLLGGGQ